MGGKTTKYLILGSGIGGLAAGAELKSKGESDFLILDKCKELPKNLHNGLHYLHTSNFGTPFPFEFKQIIRTEEIWDTRTNTFKKQATIPEMFEYSKKVMENLRHPSSIMDSVKTWESWVPASNNMDDLVEAYYNYAGEDKFLWNREVTSINLKGKRVYFNDEWIDYEYLITTIPLPKFYGYCEMKCPYELKNKPLYITNYKAENIVPNWLLVLYMSDPKFPPYRITVLNGIISMESMRELTYEDEVIIKYIAGDLFDYNLKTKSSYCWDTGRIFGMSKPERQSMLEEFGKNYVYPIGRFSRWDGTLLMDTTILQAKEIVSKI